MKGHLSVIFIENHRSTRFHCMFSSRCFFVLVLTVGFFTSATVHAGPPFITDDPEPVELHHWEVILAMQQFHTVDGWSGTSPHLDINYGAAPNLQLNLFPSVAYNKNPGQPARFGWGDVEMGFKYRFLQETDTHPQMAIYPLLDLPTANHKEDLGSGKAHLFIPIWMQKSFGKWTSYGGAGYWFNPGSGNRDYWFAGLVVERKLTENFAPAVEVQFRTPAEVDTHSKTVINGGGTLDLSEHYHILFSAGHSVQGPAEFQGYLGLQITWGPEEHKGKENK
jgi:hypothetical protein